MLRCASMKNAGLERQLKGLANKRRLAILYFLKKRKESSVGAIAEEIKLSFKSTSRHLITLDAAGLVDKEQRNLQVFYRLADDAPPILRMVLTIL